MEKEFENLTLEQQAETLEKLSSIYEKAKQERADALLAELAKLGIKAPAKARATRSAGDARGDVKPKYRGPNGEEYSGRGGIPRWAKELGITDKAGLDPYLIKD